MAWLRVDDGFTEHRKLVSLPRRDRWTWMELLTYCARQMNDGHVPNGIEDVLKHVTKVFIARCLEVGLLDEEDGGYYIHDWHVYNPRDPTNSVRQQRYRNAKRNADSNADVTANVTDENVTNVTPRAQARARVPSRPVPNPSLTPSELQDAGRNEGGNEID